MPPARVWRMLLSPRHRKPFNSRKDEGANVLNDVLGNVRFPLGRYYSPRHRMPFNSRNYNNREIKTRWIRGG